MINYNFLIMINKSILIAVLLFTFQESSYFSQSIESKFDQKKGNELYINGNYEKSLDNYVYSYIKDTSNIATLFNAGNAAYRLGDFENARLSYDHYLNLTKTKEEKAFAHYNIGNTYLKEYEKAIKDQKEAPSAEILNKSIEHYKNSLRLHPKDEDSRYNLSYALKLMQQNKDQQNKDQQNKDQQNKDQQNKDQQNKDQQNKDQQNKDQQNKDQQNKDQQNKDQQNKDQQNKDQQNKDQQNKPKGKQPEPSKSKAQAVKNLDAVNSGEEKILMKVNRQKGDKKKSKTKDW